MLVIILLVGLLAPVTGNIGNTRQKITLSDDGGYGNILIAIDESIPEDLDLLLGLQAHYTAASTALLTATEDQVYFHNITILVPSTWTTSNSWLTANGESVETANILVAPPNIMWGDTPYTLQPGGCGEEGDFTHLTAFYVKGAASSNLYPEKRLVREFAHLKWGLFNEDAHVNDVNSSNFYMFNTVIKPTQCQTDGIYGSSTDLATEQACNNVNETSQSPSPTCTFRPKPDHTSANTSLMYAEYLPSIYGFCTKDTHNKLALNKHNEICEQKSAWEVMQGLPDFAFDHLEIRGSVTVNPPTFTIIQAGATPPTTTQSTTSPTSTTTKATTTTVSTTSQTTTLEPSVECPQDIVCLLLDVSGSMSNYNRIGKLASAVTSYILYHLRNNTAVGIVSFSSTATVNAPMTLLSSDQARKDLIAFIPTVAFGTTGIGNGLLKCSEILNNYSEEDLDRSRIVLFSDGQETNQPYVVDVLPGVKADGILVDTMLYSQSADNVLMEIATETGGKSFFANDDGSKTSINLFLAETAYRDCDTASTVLINAQVPINASESSYTDKVSFDITIGMETILIFSYSNDINVEVVTGNGNNVLVTKDSSINLIIAKLFGDMSGSYANYTITKVSSHLDEEVIVTVTSQPIPNVLPISIYTRTDGNAINFSSQSTVRIYTSVYQGYTPVLNLQVTSVIETADGTQLHLPSSDSGFGMDSTANDGIYTATLLPHEFSGSGYYSLQMEVNGEGLQPDCVQTVEDRVWEL
ncbi:hypothetical protein EB796_024835 [Bugula neritina]|uniref:VWFA domain-containing protein n=1 Tax=Bugula neritina TaxID=10212 RepID=A0A7J7ITX7_BUGNE|nr:hypothetical protein EB796_024835 [Bugula neritina]